MTVKMTKLANGLAISQKFFTRFINLNNISIYYYVLWWTKAPYAEMQTMMIIQLCLPIFKK